MEICEYYSTRSTYSTCKVRDESKNIMINNVIPEIIIADETNIRNKMTGTPRIFIVNILPSVLPVVLDYIHTTGRVFRQRSNFYLTVDCGCPVEI